jgi:hypothetical protein
MFQSNFADNVVPIISAAGGRRGITRIQTTAPAQKVNQNSTFCMERR